MKRQKTFGQEKEGSWRKMPGTDYGRHRLSVLRTSTSKCFQPKARVFKSKKQMIITCSVCVGGWGVLNHIGLKAFHFPSPSIVVQKWGKLTKPLRGTSTAWQWCVLSYDNEILFRLWQVPFEGEKDLFQAYQIISTSIALSLI